MTTPEGELPDIAGLSYERALAELDQIIERLERGAVPLDEAIAAYERGARLAQRCSDLLDRTEQKVSQLVVGGGGRVSEKPFAVGRAGLTEALELAAPLAPTRREETRGPDDIDPDEIPF